MCVCVHCLASHTRKLAGHNLFPATLAVFCFVSSFLLRSFIVIYLLPFSGTEPFNITDSKELRQGKSVWIKLKQQNNHSRNCLSLMIEEILILSRCGCDHDDVLTGPYQTV